jgi:hypothetical protein
MTTLLVKTCGMPNTYGSDCLKPAEVVDYMLKLSQCKVFLFPIAI